MPQCRIQSIRDGYDFNTSDDLCQAVASSKPDFVFSHLMTEGSSPDAEVKQQHTLVEFKAGYDNN
jgi:hypothetical protein